jgi:hypothetical protein
MFLFYKPSPSPTLPRNPNLRPSCHHVHPCSNISRTRADVPHHSLPPTLRRCRLRRHSDVGNSLALLTATSN